MLYDRWRAIAQAGGSEVALRDLGDGQSWTFAELLKLSDGLSAPAGDVVFPQGAAAEFIFEVLRGWRHGRAVCPLEEGEAAPNLTGLPKWVAHVKRTSATTGAARLVIFKAEQLAADPENIVATMGLRREWPNLGVISLAHSYGFSNLVLPLLLQGIPLWLLRSPLPEPLRKALAGGGEFTLAGVPTLWRVWTESAVISQNVRLAISAGAPLPVALEEDVFKSAGVKIHNFLGSSECGGIAYDRSETPRWDGTMAGSALENVDLSVSDGLLEVRGASVASGYWPEGRVEVGEGVFRTSDLAELREGQLFLRGRATDVMHIAGRKIAPEEIERALLRHPAVKECLVFDAPRAGEENQIIAVVVGDAKQLDSIRRTLGEKHQPRQWRFVESLGANERGKVSRAVWRKRFVSSEI